MTTWVTARGIALAVGVLTPAAWLLWAEHLAGGWPTVLATAGLWWLAASQATWPVWLPAAVMLLALWLAIPPRVPRWQAFREPAEPEPAAGSAVGMGEGVAAGTDGAAAGAGGRLDIARLSLEEWRVLSRTPEGAAALAAERAEREAAREAGARALEPAPAGEAGGIDLAPALEAEAEEKPEESEDVGEEDEPGEPGPGPDDQEAAREDDDGTPEGQDPTQDPPRAAGPASGPAPPRTVWEAFAWLDREGGEDEGDDDAA